jgi:hypothetical protein
MLAITKEKAYMYTKQLSSHNFVIVHFQQVSHSLALLYRVIRKAAQGIWYSQKKKIYSYSVCVRKAKFLTNDF